MKGYSRSLSSDDDVVDRDVDELDEEADETHDGEADSRRNSDLLVLWNMKKQVSLETDRMQKN